jgi:hypothetical protein
MSGGPATPCAEDGGRLVQECPSCRHRQAAATRCRACHTETGPADWFRPAPRTRVVAPRLHAVAASAPRIDAAA